MKSAHSISQIYIICFILLFFSLGLNAQKAKKTAPLRDPQLTYQKYRPNPTDRILSRATYHQKLYGFWLGQCIANWTGLVTEMDKIGNIGEIKTGAFYTRADWGKPDQPSIWAAGIPSNLSPTIDFVLRGEGDVWGSDDDTDIEYIYQHLLYTQQTSILTGQQIQEGWLKHIKPEEENFLWVSNQKAFDLMKMGLVPPATSDPQNNPEFEMIDAQLTTAIAGIALFQYGSGPIRGFAVTLLNAIATSIFTGVMCTRLFFDFQANRRGFDRVSI